MASGINPSSACIGMFASIILACTQVMAEDIGAWQYGCEADRCSLAQAASSADKRTAVKINIVRRDKGLFALIVTPLGISLPGGILMRVDQGPEERAVFATCNIGGCFSAVPLDANRLARWKRGLTLRISYVDGSGSKIENELSLDGVTAGIQRLRNTE